MSGWEAWSGSYIPLPRSVVFLGLAVLTGTRVDSIIIDLTKPMSPTLAISTTKYSRQPAVEPPQQGGPATIRESAVLQPKNPGDYSPK